MVCGENFPNILEGRQHTLFRELYRRTLRYLLDRAQALDSKENLVAPQQRDSTAIEWNRPVRIGALRYDLPEFIDYQDPQWHKKPAPYAHYAIEGSPGGGQWTTLADRRQGPWRGRKTDIVTPVEVKYLRFNGTFSNGEPFRVRNVEVLPAR
jgi:hypothetical protein